MRREAGTYALILRASRARSIRAGQLGHLKVRRGTYVYVGSAFGPGGVLARVRHHEGISRAPHWHVDYLRPAVRIAEVWYSHDPIQREHQWAGILAAMRGASVPLPRFGASDCRCGSHLFFFESPPSLRSFRGRIRAAAPEHRRMERAGADKFAIQNTPAEGVKSFPGKPDAAHREDA